MTSRVGAAVAMVLAAAFLTVTPGGAPASQAGQSPSTRVAPVADEVDFVLHPGSRYTIRKWPRRFIYFSDALPASYDWSIKKAIAEWNTANIGIKFRRAPASRAKLKIVFGDTGGAAGLATLGYSAYYPNRVWLAPGDVSSWRSREVVSRVIAHELGHVLGLMHTDGPACSSLMLPVLDTGCVPRQVKGYYSCRWATYADGRPAARRYGGRFRIGPENCLVLPLPPPLDRGDWSGGDPTGPVEFSWDPPDRYPDGTAVIVLATPRRADTGCALNTRTERFRMAPSRLRWREENQTKGEVCYRARIANKLGAGRPALDKQGARYAPAPRRARLSTTTTTDGYAYSTTATQNDPDDGSAIPDDSRLRYQATPLTTSNARVAETCAETVPHPVTAKDEAALDGVLTEADRDPRTGLFEFQLLDLVPHCVTFYVTNRWGNTSDGTGVVVTPPLPEEITGDPIIVIPPLPPLPLLSAPV